MPPRTWHAGVGFSSVRTTVVLRERAVARIEEGTLSDAMTSVVIHSP
jgi:hypothetical protein